MLKHVQYRFTSTKTRSSLGRTAQDGHLDSHTAPELSWGKEGKREIIYVSLLCHHQTDFCIKMGSDESQFYVSLIARDKVTRQWKSKQTWCLTSTETTWLIREGDTRQCPQTTAFEEKGEPKRIRTEVPLVTAKPYR